MTDPAMEEERELAAKWQAVAHALGARIAGLEQRAEAAEELMFATHESNQRLGRAVLARAHALRALAADLRAMLVTYLGTTCPPECAREVGRLLVRCDELGVR